MGGGALATVLTNFDEAPPETFVNGPTAAGARQYTLRMHHGGALSSFFTALLPTLGQRNKTGRKDTKTAR